MSWALEGSKSGRAGAEGVHLSFKDVKDARVMVEGEVPWSDLRWRNRGFQAGSCSDNQLCHLGRVSLSGPQVSHWETRRPGWDQGSSSSVLDPTTGCQVWLVKDKRGCCSRPGRPGTCRRLPGISVSQHCLFWDSQLSCSVCPPAKWIHWPSSQYKPLSIPFQPDNYLYIFSNTDIFCT